MTVYFAAFCGFSTAAGSKCDSKLAAGCTKLDEVNGPDHVGNREEGCLWGHRLLEEDSEEGREHRQRGKGDNQADASSC